MRTPNISLSAWLLYTFCILPVILFAGLMVYKVVPYYGFEHAYAFLSTKTNQTLALPVFRFGFYVHIGSSAIVLLSALPQLMPQLARHYPVVHRYAGRVYVFTILVLAATSGLVLALYANGGLPAKTGFFMQCLVWWFVTFMAYLKARKHQYQEHIAWMLRSFAITLAALSLRTEGYLMHYLLHTKPIETYVTITWLSWVGNWLLAEVLIALGLHNFLYKKYINKTN
jgi:hypothetical protein